MHYTEVQDEADLCLRFKLIDSNKHHDIVESIHKNKGNENGGRSKRKYNGR